MNRISDFWQENFNFRSAESWQLIFLLLTLTAGFLSIAVSQITLGVGLACLLYRWTVLKQPPAATGLEKTAIALALWALLTIPFSTYQMQSIIYYRRFYLFAAIWLASGLASNQDRRLLLLWFLLAGALIISLYGQIFHLIHFGGLLKIRMSEVFNSMTGGALLMMAGQIAVGFLLAPGLARRLKVIVALVAIPVILGLVMTMTRGALLGMIFGLGVMLILTRPRLFLPFLGIMVLAVVVVGFFGEHFLPAGLWQRVDPQYLLHGKSTALRLEMWKGGLEMVKAHPVFGVGDRGIAEIAPDYYTSQMGTYFGHLHSNIVQMAVIWGIPGLILGQAFIWAGLWYLVKRFRELWQRVGADNGLPVKLGWVLGGIGVWVSFYLAGLTEWYFGDAEPMLIYLAILGCALGKDEPVAGNT